MNMERVKSIIIVCLLMLNIVLAGFNIANSSGSRLSQERIDNITALMEKGNITLSTEMLTDLKPRSYLYVSDDVRTHDELAAILGVDITTVYAGEENASDEQNQPKLVFSEDNTFIYDNTRGMGALNDFSEQTALEAAQKLADELVPSNLKLKLYSTSSSSGYYIFDFRGHYSGQMVYSTYLRVTVGEEGGIVYIKGSLFAPVETSTETNDIYAADEALVTLMQQLQYRYGDIAIDISGMEMVYYVTEYKASSGSSIADPCYLFTAVVNNVEVPIIVSAYSNTVVK